MKPIPTLSRLTIAMAITLSTGCSVWVPYVEPPAVNAEEDALTFARDAQNKLTKAAREHAGFNSGVGSALIPLASLVAYKGFAGGNSHNIAALATGGAAGFGVANYVYRPRDVIYLAGAAAIDCAIGFSAPDMLAPDTKQKIESARSQWHSMDGGQLHTLATVHNELQRLAGHLVEADQQLNAANRYADALPTPVTIAVRNRVHDARSVYAQADSARARAHEFRAALMYRIGAVSSGAQRRLQTNRRASDDLINATRAILIQVNQQLALNQPDPSKLADKLTQLKLPVAATEAKTTMPLDTSIASAAAAMKLETSTNSLPIEEFKADFTPTTENAAISAKAAAESLRFGTEAINKALDALSKTNEGLRNLHAAATNAEALLDDPAPPLNLARLMEQCGVEGKLPTPLTVSQPQGGAKVSAGKQLQLPIVGGTKPYAPTLLTKPAKGELKLELMQGLGNSRTLIISTSADTTHGKYIVLVQDARASVVQVTVEVGP